MWPVIVCFFLIAYGLIHLSYPLPSPDDPKYPFDLHKSWLIRRFGMKPSVVCPLGKTLTFFTVFRIALTGLVIVSGLIPASWWQSLSAASALLSLLVLALFWHLWLVLGDVIDLGLLVSLFVLHSSPYSVLRT